VLVDGLSVGAVTGHTFPNVTANHTIAASFAIDTFTITASAGPNGSISPAGAVSVNYGASQAFVIAPAGGYHVADVLVDGLSVGAVTGHTIPNVTANHTIAASFGVDVFALTTNVAGSGGVTRLPNQASYPYGASVTITAVPAAGFAFGGWSGDSVTTANPLTIGMFAAHTYTATFADSTRPVVSALAPNGGETFTAGTTVPLTWTASDNVGVAAVDLLLSRTGAAGPFDPLALGLANSGSYSWPVTGPATTAAFFRVVARDSAGNAGAAQSAAAFSITVPTGVDDAPVTAFALSPVRPNPMLSGGHFGFALPRAATVHLALLDVQGREIATLANGEFPAGRHSIAWQSRGSGSPAPGLYFVRLGVPGATFVKRFVLMK